MNDNIKGITIEINGDTTPLQSALSSADDKAKATANELGQINKALKFDGDNVTLLGQKMDVLKDRIGATEEKLKTLKDAKSQVDQQFKNGEINAEQYRAFQREIEIAESQLRTFKGQLGDTASAFSSHISPVSKVKDAYGNMKDGVKQALDSFKAEHPKAAAAIELVGKTAKGVGEAGLTVFKAELKAVQVAGAALATGLGAVAAAVTKVTTEAVKGYAEQEQLVGGVETLFGAKGARSVDEYAKSVGKSTEQVQQEYANLEKAQQLVMNNANNAFKTAGLSANEYMETATGTAAAMISALDGDTVKAAKLTDQAIIDMADNANKMGTSMESIQNAYAGFAKGQYNMLDNLKLGYGGTKEEMQRLLEDATKLSGVEYDISSYADIVQAIHVVQENLGIAGTTAKEASETIQGSVASTKAAFQNLVTGLASPDADLSQLIDNLFESADNVVNNIVPVVQRVLEALPGTIEDFSVSIQNLLQNDVLQNIIQEIPDLFEKIVDVIAQEQPALLQAGGQMLLTLAEGFAANAAEIMDSAVWMVEQLVSGLQESDTVERMVNAAVAVVTALVNGLAEMAPMLLSGAVILITQLATSLTSPDNLNALITSAITLTITLLSAIIENAPMLVSAALEMARILVETLITYDWRSVAVQIFNSIKGSIKNAISNFGGGKGADEKGSGGNGYAGGLGYVPDDNYIAILHQGERVLTAAENARYHGGSSEFYNRLDSKLASIECRLEQVGMTAVTEINYSGSIGRLARALAPEIRKENKRKTTWKDRRA